MGGSPRTPASAWGRMSRSQALALADDDHGACLAVLVRLRAIGLVVGDPLVAVDDEAVGELLLLRQPEGCPPAAILAQLHRSRRGTPLVEVAREGHALRVGPRGRLERHGDFV